MIPKVIHYCWFGGNKFPVSAKKCVESWKKFCPDYKIVRWSESNFDVNSHPFVKAAYQAKSWAFVSDYVRLKVIYEYGGIYLDTDVQLLKNLDHLLCYDCYFGLQQNPVLVNTGLGFGGSKNNNIIKAMLDIYDDVVYDSMKVKEIACPFLNNRVLSSLGTLREDGVLNKSNRIKILPPKYLDPLSPGNTTNLLCEDTISIHHYSASWKKHGTIIKRRVVFFIGAKNIYLLKYLIGKVKHIFKLS